MKNLETALSYGIPITHDSDQSRSGIQVKSHKKFPSLTCMGVQKSNIQLCEEWQGHVQMGQCIPAWTYMMWLDSDVLLSFLPCVLGRFLSHSKRSRESNGSQAQPKWTVHGVQALSETQTDRSWVSLCWSSVWFRVQQSHGWDTYSSIKNIITWRRTALTEKQWTTEEPIISLLPFSCLNNYVFQHTLNVSGAWYPGQTRR